MSMRGIMWAVLAESPEQYERWVKGALDDPPWPNGFSLQRCKPIFSMLDVYQAQKGHVEIIKLPGWDERWNTGQIMEIVRRLDL